MINEKIMFFASSISYGGAEKMLCFVANSLAKSGYAVTVVNLQEKKGEEQKLQEEIEHIRLQPSSFRYIGKIKQWMDLIKIAKRKKPDIIISFKFTPNYLAAGIGKLLRIPVIVSERADPAKEDLSSIKARIYWNLINSADGGVFQTKYAQQYYKKHLQKEGTIIENPVYTTRKSETEKKNGQDSHIVVSVGRLDNEQKRYDIMLKAFLLFHEEYACYKLKIYGTGPDEAQILKWITENGMNDYVTLEGYTNDPIGVLLNSELFLITSDYEGISNALLEAMSAGLPVVSTDSSPGGAGMLIQNGYNGILVPTGDIQAIADALKRYASDAILKELCAKNAMEVNKRFAPDRVAKRWEDYILKVMDNYKRR